MKIIAIERADGAVSIMRLLLDSADIPTEVAKWAAGSNLVVASFREISEGDIPADRTFRNAWCCGADGKVRPEIARCKAIWREKIRVARAPQIAALDIEYQRADEQANVVRKQEIAARKQALRDAPQDPRIDAAKTPEELKLIQPAGLTVK